MAITYTSICTHARMHTHAHTHACTSTCTNTYTHPFYGPLDSVRDYPDDPVPKPIWILLKQETMSSSGISWAICKSAPQPRQITMPTSHHSVFTGRMPFLPPSQPTVSKHWKHIPVHIQTSFQQSFSMASLVTTWYKRQWKETTENDKQ